MVDRLSDITISANKDIVSIVVSTSNDTFKQVVVQQKYVMKNYKFIANIDDILEKYYGRAISKVCIEDYTPTPNYPNGGLCVKLKLCGGSKKNTDGTKSVYNPESITLYECKFTKDKGKNRTIVV